MKNMAIKLDLHSDEEMKPKIAVFGVGGGGVNAISNMVSSNLEGVDFFAANTDMQALEGCLASQKIKLGVGATKGLGAGSDPEVGRIAAEESVDEIIEALEGYNMVFITAGMGGGTGTGAAPVVAKLAREKGILTIGVCTKPFHFEGMRRMKTAENGLDVLQDHVDTLIIIPNQNLFRLANEKTTFSDAFKMADGVLHQGVRGVTELLTNPGLINLDFADINSVMNEKGKAMMGTGEAEDDGRAVKAAEAAISNPLLDHSSMKGARGVLINITGGMDMTLFEVDEVANRIKEEVDDEANIIFGSAFNSDLEGKIRVSVVATGIDAVVPKTISHDMLAEKAVEKEVDGSVLNTDLKAPELYRDGGEEGLVDVNQNQHNFEGGDGKEDTEEQESLSLSSGKNFFVKKDDTEAKVISQGLQDKPISSLANKPAEVQNSFFDIPTFLRNKNKE
jgi:cell division protein FtsZ